VNATAVPAGVGVVANCFRTNVASGVGTAGGDHCEGCASGAPGRYDPFAQGVHAALAARRARVSPHANPYPTPPPRAGGFGIIRTNQQQAMPGDFKCIGLLPPAPHTPLVSAFAADGGMRALQDGAAREADAAGSGCQRACGGGGRCGGQSGAAQDGNVRPVSLVSARRPVRVGWAAARRRRPFSASCYPLPRPTPSLLPPWPIWRHDPLEPESATRTGSNGWAVGSTTKYSQSPNCPRRLAIRLQCLLSIERIGVF
jgi:hypothetical protein